MKINIFRIDDRLIHGQIITGWIGDANAKRIVVIDDLAASDEFQQTILKMATPSGIELVVISSDAAIDYISNDESNTNTLVLVRSVSVALKLVENGLEIPSINVGNINMKKGRTKLLSNLWLNEEEVEEFRRLDKLTIKLDLRTVPTDRSQNAMTIINKTF